MPTARRGMNRFHRPAHQGMLQLVGMVELVLREFNKDGVTAHNRLVGWFESLRAHQLNQYLS